ncbi:MAG: hypothetical protein J0I41_05095, partial [Filimonas sp.]|nr:hypothetical protein [Filimonas sp.]
MSSFKATLTVDNVPYNLAFCKFIYHQNTNLDGSPSSAVQGGIISLVLEKPAPKSLLGWMLSPTDKRDGAIRFYEVNILSGTHQSLSFENAGCITFR